MTRSLHTRSLFLLLGLWAGGAPLAAGPAVQDPVEEEDTEGLEDLDAEPEGPALDPEAARTIEKFRAYLARNPYHHSGFERLVDAAVEAGWLDPLVREVEAEVQARSPEDPGAEAGRVLLARLYARTQRAGEALALLEGLVSENAELDLLRGDVLLAEGRVEEGLAALEAAVGRASDRALQERLHRRLGEALLAAGERERAARAYRDLGALDPDDHALQVEVAEALARAGLLDDAAEVYARAAELAGGDAPRLCRVLAATGRLAERRGANDEALEAYGRAIDLLGRGHWLKRELLTRVLAAHVRAGSLEALAEELAARVGDDPSDLDRRELLARARVELRDLDGARVVLAAAVADFPGDLELGRSLLEVLERVGDDDGRVQEYQRLIDQHPGELELYVELGQVLALGGKLEQARVQWERSLETRLSDPTLCLRLADLHAHYDLHEEALELVRRALQLAPEDLTLYGDLCGALHRAGHGDEVPAALERARALAGDDPARLEAHANLVRGHGSAREALVALERALEAQPEAARLLRAQAELLAEVGDDDGARASLRRLVQAERDSAARRDAARRLLRHALRGEGLKAFADAEADRLRAAPEDATGQLLLAMAEQELGREGRARAAFERLLELDPGDELARAALAELHEALGRPDLAQEQFRALVELRPRQRARWLEQVARVQEDAGEREEARSTWEEVLRVQTRTPASLAEAAKAFVRLDREERAAELLREAVRLAPDDADLRLQLAGVYEELEQYDRVREEVRAATRTTDPDARDRARERWYELLLDEDAVETEIARLRQAIEANPYDEELPQELIDLHVRELEYTLALDLIDGLLTYRPRDVALLDRRARLYEDMERWEETLGDLQTLATLPETEGLDLDRRLAQAYLSLGDRDAAGRVLVELGDPARVAEVYHRAGLVDDAREQLERALAARPDDRRLLQRQVLFCRTTGDLDAALVAQERLIALEGDDPRHLDELARLHLARGDDDGVMDALARRVADVALPVEDDSLDEKERKAALRRAHVRLNRRLSELQQFLWSNQLWQQESRLALELARRYPASSVLFDRAVSQLAGEQKGDELLEFLAATRAATLDQGVLPAGYDEARWRRQIQRREDQAWRTIPELAARRAEQLAQDTSSLSESEVQELMGVYAEQGQHVELLALMDDAAERFERHRVRYLSAAALALLELGEDERAVERLEQLRVLQAEELPRERRMTGSYGKRLLRTLPEELQGLATDDVVERHWRLSNRNTLSATWSVGREPDLPEVELALAATLGRLGRTDEACTLALRWLPEERDLIHARAWMFEYLRGIGCEAALTELQASCWQVLEEVAADPVLRHDRTWSGEVRGVVTRRMNELRDAGEPGAAWELALRWFGRDAARAFLVDGAPAVRDARRQAYADALAACPAGELTPEAREALILHATLLADAAQVEELAGVLRDARARGMDDPQLLLQVARLDAAAGDVATAIASLRAAAEEAEAQVRESKQIPPPSTEVAASGMVSSYDGDGSSDPYTLHLPTIELGAEDPGGAFGEMLQAMAWGMPQGNPDTWISAPHRIELARLAWGEGDFATVTEELKLIQDRAPSIFGYARWELANAIESIADPAPLIGVLELLYDQNETDGTIVLRYGKALTTEGRGEDAQRLYRKFLRAANRDDYRYDEVERALAVLVGEPEETRRTLPELREAVEADPRNARLRLALVQALREASDHAAALEQALEAERLAPHLDDVRRQARELCLIAGDVAGYRRRLSEELQRTQDKQQRASWSISLASLAWEEGDEAGARELLRELQRSQTTDPDYSAARFYLDRERPDLALEILGEEIELIRKGGQVWYADQLEEARAAFALREGDARSFLETLWEQMEREGTPGLNASDLERVQQAIGQAHAHPDLPVRLASLGEELDGDLGTLARILAARLAKDSVREEELLVAHALAHPTSRDLGLQAVAGARQREDWSAARTALERLAERYRPSPRRMVDEVDPPASEAALYAAERGALLYAEGRTEEAVQLWRQELGGSDAGRRLLLRLCVERGLDEIVAELREQLAGRELGAGEELYLAASELRGGDASAALGHLLKALPPEQDARYGPDARTCAVRERIEACHRELGSLEAWRQELRGVLTRHPEDVDAGLRVTRLTLELEGHDAAQDEAFALRGEQHNFLNLYEAMQTLAREQGDLERAVEWGRRLAGLRKHLGWRGYRDNATLDALWDLGRREDALDLLRAGQEDPEGNDAWSSVADFLRRKQDWEGVLDAVGRVTGGNRQNLEGLRQQAYEKLGRDGDVTVLLTEIAGRWGAYPPLWDRGWARRFLGPEQLEQALAALEETPEDPERLARVAVLQQVLGDPTGCLATLDRLDAVRPGAMLALGLRWRVEEELNDLDGAIASLEASLDLARRMRAVGERTLDENQLLRERARLRLKRDGFPGARAAWRDITPSPFTVQLNEYQIWSLSQHDARRSHDPGADFLWVCGDVEGYLERQRSRDVVRGAGELQDLRLAEARVRHGDSEAGLADLLEDAARSVSHQQLLLSLHRERGTVDALLEQVRDAGEAAGEHLEWWLLKDLDRPLEAAACLVAHHPDWAEHAGLRAAVAELRLAAGDAAGALEALGPRPERTLEIGFRTTLESLPGFEPLTGAGDVRFAFGESNLGGGLVGGIRMVSGRSYSITSYSSGLASHVQGPRPARDLDLRASVARALGQPDADALELEAVQEGTQDVGRLVQAWTRLGQFQLEHGLPEAAAATWERGDAAAAEAGQDRRGLLFLQLAQWLEHGRPDLAERWEARYLERLEAEVEDPKVRAWDRVRLQTRVRFDPERCAAEVRAAQELDPDGLAGLDPTDRGWVALLAADAPRAEACFREAFQDRSLRLRAATPPGDELRYGLGIALWELGRREEGGAELRRALAEHPRSVLASRARELLGS